MLETLFFKVLWTSGDKHESVSTNLLMNIHIYKRVHLTGKGY